MIRLTKAFFDITKADYTAFTTIVLVIVLTVIFVDERRIRFQCVLNTQYRRQDLVVYLNLRNCFNGRTFGLRQYCNHRFAFPANLIDGKHGFVLRSDLDQGQYGVNIVRHICGSQNPDHARVCLRCQDINS